MIEKIEMLLESLKGSAADLMEKNSPTKDFDYEYALGMLLVVRMIEDAINGE
jgi:hypothetical protein